MSMILRRAVRVTSDYSVKRAVDCAAKRISLKRRLQKLYKKLNNVHVSDSYNFYNFSFDNEILCVFCFTIDEIFAT